MGKPTITYDAPNNVAPTQDMMKRHWDGVQPGLHVTVAFVDDSDAADIAHNLVLPPGDEPAVLINFVKAWPQAGLPLISFPDGNTLSIDRSVKGSESGMVLDVWIHRRGFVSVAAKK